MMLQGPQGLPGTHLHLFTPTLFCTLVGKKVEFTRDQHDPQQTWLGKLSL
jgi:hypothetical protein